MKTSAFFFILFFVLTSLISAQGFISVTGTYASKEVMDMIVDQDSIIYLGTPYNPSSIMKSTDKGVTWINITGITSTPNGSAYNFAVSPNNTVYVCTNSSVYSSTNQGETWVLKKNVGNFTYSIVISPGNVIAVASYKGIFCSTDDGISWTQKLDSIWVTQLYYVDNYFFAVSLTKGVYRSSDSGMTWQLIHDGRTGNYIMTSLACKESGTLLFNSQEKLYKTTNYGDDWTLISNSFYAEHLLYDTSGRLFIKQKNMAGVFVSYDDGLTYSLHSLPVNKISNMSIYNDELYCCSASGLYRLNDSGSKRIYSENYELSRRQNLMLTDDGLLIAYSRSYEGLFISKDFGNSWTDIFPDFACFGFAVSPKNIIYAGVGETDGMGIYKTADFGITWQRLSINEKISSLMIDNTDALYAGTFGTTGYIYKSTDEGVSWQQMLSIQSSNQGLVEEIFAVDDSTLLATFRNYYYPSGYSYIYGRTTNSGLHWDWTISGENVISDFSFDEKKDILAFNYGLFKSTDKGLTWNSENIPGNYPNSFAFNSNYDLFLGNNLYTSWGSNLYKKSYGTNDWLEVAYLNQYMAKIKCFKDTLIFAVAQDGIIYKANQASLTEADNENQIPGYSLFQNYPNPFNPVTNIDYSLAASGYVNIKIYDILGTEIKELVNEYKTPGFYSVKFNASDFSSGVYFYKMKSEGFTSVKKLLLLK